MQSGFGLSAYVDMGTAVPIGFRSADHLTGDRRDFSHTEDQEADQVHCRIAFTPFEVDVRQTVGAIPYVLQRKEATAPR